MHSPVYQANTGMFMPVSFKYNYGMGMKSLVEVLLLIGLACFWKCINRDFEKTSSSVGIWDQPCNDIYQNVQRKPHFSEMTNKWEWIQTNESNSELRSILDMLEKLRGVTNAPRKFAPHPAT